MLAKIGEVWKTKSDNAVLIVNSVDKNQKMMLWYDPIDNELVVSQLLNRLETKLDATEADWRKALANIKPGDALDPKSLTVQKCFTIHILNGNDGKPLETPFEVKDAIIVPELGSRIRLVGVNADVPSSLQYPHTELRSDGATIIGFGGPYNQYRVEWNVFIPN
jgi:hypothetical protein